MKKDPTFSGGCALVTGASSGIGYATAELLAKNGCDLILFGRRQARLELAAREFSKNFGVKVRISVCDITNLSSVQSAFKELGDALDRLTILVNSAGLAKGTSGMGDAAIADWDAMIDTNVKGLLYVTRHCLPYLLGGRSAHIVNVGSVAGRWTYPGGGVYCATKFAVRALTEGLRLDLMGKKIRVTTIEPGMVETEFSEVRYDGDKNKAKNVYKGMTPLSAHDIAETIVWCLDRPAHVNVQELVIYPTDQAGVGPSYVTRNEK